jgi:hypothetical protein
VYAERDDDFPKRDVVAAANITSVLNPLFQPSNR